VFLLLTVTAPARAAIIEYVNLDFGNGYKEIGNLEFFSDFRATTDPTVGGWVYLNGSRLPPPPIGCCGFKTFPGDLVQLSGGPPVNVFDLVFPDNRLPLTFSDFSLNGVTAVSGDVSVVPLPAALPLFGSAVLGLAGLAWKRKRTVSA
jgi:hypothetical protein